MRKFPLAVGLSVGIFLLSIFSSIAQASWSAKPVYNVTARQPAAPNPGANVPNQGNVPADTPVSGTITATFTWEHDVPGDSPPSKVYVLQHGSAGWGPGIDDEVDPGGGGEARTINPSTRDALFLPRSRPRFRLIQAQGTDGTSDNGLGDPQIVNTPGTRGNSTGYKIVVCNSNGNTVTTPPLTLSASKNGTPTSHYKSYWSYDAVVMDVKITRNTTDITTGKPEAAVMVGEPNQMGVSFSPVPPDAAPPTYQWTIPGDKVKNFEETAGGPNATPNAPSPTFGTGKIIALPAVDLQTATPKFFWYNGTFAGESQEVQVVISVDGEDFTIKGKCKVYRPKINLLVGQYTTNNPKAQFYGGQLTFGLGPTRSPGITWNADVEAPNVPNAAGSVSYEQFDTFDNTAGTPEHIAYKWQGTDVLDSVDSDARYPDPCAITPGAISALDSNDSPALGVLSSDTFGHKKSDFETYVVYRPGNETDGGIWVVLGKLTWGLEFTGTRNNTQSQWSVTTTTSPITIVNDTHNFKEWSKRSKQIPEVLTP